MHEMKPKINVKTILKMFKFKCPEIYLFFPLLKPLNFERPQTDI